MVDKGKTGMRYFASGIGQGEKQERKRIVDVLTKIANEGRRPNILKIIEVIKHGE